MYGRVCLAENRMAIVRPVLPPTSRAAYRSLIAIIAVQFFGNQMAGSFWLVYLVSPPNALAFHLGVLRSEEHTSELQSQSNLVCRLLLEKKKIRKEQN